VVGRELLQCGQNLESLFFLATKKQVARRLRHENNEDQGRRDEQSRESDWETPRDRVGLDPRECKCEPIREGDAKGNASTEADKKESATTLLETFGLPCGNGGCDEAVMVSIRLCVDCDWTSLPVADTSDDTSCNVLSKREGGTLDNLSDDLD
jgi:hypothetical protein